MRLSPKLLCNSLLLLRKASYNDGPTCDDMRVLAKAVHNRGERRRQSVGTTLGCSHGADGNRSMRAQRSEALAVIRENRAVP
jgi:hypothetical protein